VYDTRYGGTDDGATGADEIAELGGATAPFEAEHAAHEATRIVAPSSILPTDIQGSSE
jgi:hypothetical protein